MSDLLAKKNPLPGFLITDSEISYVLGLHHYQVPYVEGANYALDNYNGNDKDVFHGSCSWKISLKPLKT
jgi:hypothetical protein